MPLGAEVSARGPRADDGSLIATELEVKPNGIAMFEREAAAAADSVETLCLREGVSFDVEGNRLRPGGRLFKAGPEVDRVTRVLQRIVPPYLKGAPLRVYVVETPVWNASVRPNGSIWVHTGLLADLQSEDELAVVLGHELAHYSHEHARRSAKKGFWIQLASGAAAGIATIDNPSARDALVQLGSVGVQAWFNGYSRGFEEQADRVGLRYAHESGYNVAQAVAIWDRSLRRDGQMNRVANVLFGSHPRPTERIQTSDVRSRTTTQAP